MKNKHKKEKIIKKLKNIFYLMKPIWKHGRAFFVATTISNTITFIAFTFITISYSALLINLAIKGVSLLQLIMVGVIAGIAWLILSTYQNIFNSCYEEHKKEYIAIKIKREIYLQSCRIDCKYIDDPKFYDNYQFVIDNRERAAGNARSWLISILQLGITGVGLITIIATIGPWLFAIIAAKFVFDVIFNKRMAEINIEHRESLIAPNRKLDYVKRIFYQRDYAIDIRTTILGHHILRRYDNAGNEKVANIKKYSHKMLFVYFMKAFIWQAFDIIIIVYLLATIVLKTPEQLPVYTMLMAAYYELTSILQRFADNIRWMDDLSGYAKRFREFDNTKSTIEPSKAGKEVNEGSFSLSFENVQFQYENSNFCIKDVTLNIKSGEKIAIVGKNGVGKSTFIKLILGLYNVDSGVIKINGCNLCEYNIHKLREKIGVAFQDSNIYALTLNENVNMYEVNYNRNNIKSNFIDNIIEKNNATMNTEVTKEFDESGIVLSGGEAQKIALARVLGGDFGLVILDEPSSALDPLAEYEMAKDIFNVANKNTTLMVAHRLSSVREADRIVVFDNGEIKEIGTHKELMQIKGIYFDMFTKQAEKYDLSTEK